MKSGNHPPNPPKPPLGRYLNEWSSIFCPKCGSSMVRKFFIFGERKCIHPECGFKS